MITIALSALAGALTWTFLEYCIHRWLGHYVPFRPNPFATEHVRHHSEGNYFAPTWKKGLLTLGLLLVAGTPAAWLAGWSGAAFVLGLVAFYLCYELLHRREHTHAGWGAYGRWARRHHFHHHFVDPNLNHGVTSPLWDFVFRTYAKPSVIKVPAKLMMPWLGDAKGVHPEFASVYVLKPQRTR